MSGLVDGRFHYTGPSIPEDPVDTTNTGSPQLDVKEMSR